MGSKNSCPIIITSKRCGTCQNLTWLSKFRGSWASVKQSPFHKSSYLKLLQHNQCTDDKTDLDADFDSLYNPNFIRAKLVIWCCFVWILCRWYKKAWCSLERWINFIVTLYVTHSRLSEAQKLDIKLGKNLLKFKDKRQIFS